MFEKFNEKMKIDFIEVINRLFKNKIDYKLLIDKDKEDNFFMVNRKIATKYIKGAQFFNSRYVDKATALDIWKYFFRNAQGIPSWYWAPKNRTKTPKTKTPKKDIEKITSFYDLNNDDFLFLEKYFKDNVDYEIKKLKRFEE